MSFSSWYGGSDVDVKEAKQAIQDLIDEFPDNEYVECLEEMIDTAQTALDAAREDAKDDNLRENEG